VLLFNDENWNCVESRFRASEYPSLNPPIAHDVGKFALAMSAKVFVLVLNVYPLDPITIKS